MEKVTCKWIHWLYEWEYLLLNFVFNFSRDLAIARGWFLNSHVPVTLKNAHNKIEHILFSSKGALLGPAPLKKFCKGALLWPAPLQKFYSIISGSGLIWAKATTQKSLWGLGRACGASLLDGDARLGGKAGSLTVESCVSTLCSGLRSRYRLN